MPGVTKRNPPIALQNTLALRSVDEEQGPALAMLSQFTLYWTHVTAILLFKNPALRLNSILGNILQSVSVHSIIAIAAFVCATIVGMTASFVVFQIVDKVNEHLPQDKQFSHFGWYWSKFQRLSREYRTYYPTGNLLSRYYTLFGIVCLCMMVCAWALGFFSR